MSAFGRNAFRAYVILLGIWAGSGVHDTASTHFAWWADPVAWYARPAWEGLVNPWPFSTMLVLLATIVAGVVAWRYRGPGRKEALISLGGTALILVATLAWFVPQLGLMDSGKLDDTAMVAHGRTWIVLNAGQDRAAAGADLVGAAGFGADWGGGGEGQLSGRARCGSASPEVRDFAVGVAPNETVEGMAAMSRKFRDLGGEIEVKVE